MDPKVQVNFRVESILYLVIVSENMYAFFCFTAVARGLFALV